MKENRIQTGLELLKAEFGMESVDQAIMAVKNFDVEVPSWVFGEFGGGRFGEYSPPAAARNIYEKLDDAAMVHKLTGAASQVAMHILWDFSEDGYNGDLNLARKISEEAKTRGVKLGSVNPTYFLKGSHRGSLSANENETGARYIEQTVQGAEIAKNYGVGLLCLWLPDGSMYPGQSQIREAIANTRENLKKISAQVDKDVEVLIEYKVFEPGTYSTVIPDWGSAYLLAKEFGPNAGVLVDMGHHHHATNIEQIVARLIDDGIRAGFHFNTRYAADDDHSVEPNPEMARIFYELVQAGVICNNDASNNWAYMIDQCSGRENRMLAIIHSIDSLQLSLAKASLVDAKLLKQHQDEDEIILANRTFNDALFNADVRPIVMAARMEKNLNPVPIQAYLESGYQKQIELNRK